MPKHDPPGDDAALLELERELMELDRAIRAAEENREAIDYALFDRRDELMARIFNTPAAGLAGLAVQARAYLSEHEVEFAEGEGGAGLLADRRPAGPWHPRLGGTRRWAGPVTERQEPAFLMTPAQHRQWAANARRRNRPDLAKHHEQLARAIEITEWRRQAECPNVDSPSLAHAS